MNTGQKISTLRNKHGWAQPKLADLMSVSQSTIAMWESGKRKISADDLVKLSQLFNVSVDYLLGNNTLNSDDAAAPISQENSNDLIEATQSIPVYGAIHAGAPAFAEQNIIGVTAATDRIVHEYGRQNLFALQINGDSMSRVIPNGYTAVFAKDIGIENGDIVAVLVDHEEATIKRFRKTSVAVIFEPDSYNESYKPIIFPENEEQDFKILGKYLYASSLPI
ncbi:helix-turn-helix domain-containing protein [Secundilactobacillus kimchicus]|uniref:helix-turn-helix domain-containing protein n=1 Tax=Secundilactobacillus kimchicus TaxID=528209 RepID=UPI0024A9041A|nr:XRE family transcriptional regulator [Secundilactobacillus kimchicus]